MKLLYLEKLVIIVAGVSGLIQGTAWMILSIICIVFYNTQRIDQEINHYSDVFETNVYNRFLNDENPYGLKSDIVTPRNFTIFMWMYFLSNFILIVLSSMLLIISRLNKNIVLNSIKTWLVVSGIVLILDFFLTILLGCDYDNCLKRGDGIVQNSTSIEVEHFCADTIIPVVVVASKGFILWIMDFLMMIVLFKIATIVKQKVTDENETRLPRVSIQRNPNTFLEQQRNPQTVGSPSPQSAQNFVFPPGANYHENRGKTWGADRTQTLNPQYNNNNTTFNNAGRY